MKISIITKVSQQGPERTFNILLGLMFASLFFGQALMNVVALMFVVALLIYRPRLPWIAPFWWLLAFTIWEPLSNYLGPYPFVGEEFFRISYHFLILFLPLSLAVIDYEKLLKYITVGAVTQAILMWIQGFVGVSLHAPPLRINWEGGPLFSRPPGFNARAWITQFNHSIITLAILPYIEWKKPKAWLLIAGLFTGVILPQIRAVIAAFIAGLGLQILFSKENQSRKEIVKRFLIVFILAVVCLSAVAMLRPDFFKNLSTVSGRDQIFAASYEVFTHNPTTGIGAHAYFKDLYMQAWKDLGMHTDPPSWLEIGIGHQHSDYLMLLVRHGWPSLLFWLGFVIHSLVFVWKYGDKRERILYTSLIVMHHVAGLAETYLDYTNTMYAIALCYGLALHGPIKRYQASRVPVHG